MRISNIRVSYRLSLLSVAYMVPILVLAYFALSGVGMPIDFAKQEQLGNQYQRPLEKLLKGVPEHGMLYKQKLAGVEVSSDLTNSAGQIDSTIKELQQVDSQIGQFLQFDDDSLRKAGREAGKVSVVVSKWRELQSSLDNLSAADSDAKHAEIVSSIQLMIAHVGDKSNLILDPDLDSYYVMDATLLALPQTQARIAQIVSFGHELFQSGEVPEAAKIELEVHARMLREADIARVKASLDVALKEDENFYGTQSTLQQTVPPLLEDYAQKAEEFAGLLDRMAQGEHVNYSSFVEAGRKAGDSAFALWEDSIQELDRLLSTRLAHFEGVKFWTIAPSLGSVMLAWLLAWVLSNSITRPFKSIMGQLNEASGQLGEGSSQLASASQALAQRGTEQAASLEETAAALEEIASVSKHNTANSEQAMLLAQSAREASEQGVGAMKSMMSAIHSIKSSADETAQIVKIIDEIAFQTNLLALNAAVEAARAGDAGKGFAVVAEEVRNLAQRSANAAKESSEKIRQSKDLAENGVKVTEDVATSLTAINQSVVKSADLMKEITAAGKEQTTGIGQINISVAELDKVTQQNSAAAEESSASAEQLTAQASVLEEVVHSLGRMIYGAGGAESVAPPVIASAEKTSAKSHKVRYVQPASDNGEEQVVDDLDEVIPMGDSDSQRI